IASLAIFNFVVGKIGFGIGGTTGTINTGSGGTTLDAPTDLRESQITPRAATVSFTSVPGATAYRVQWGEGNNFSGESPQITTTSFEILSLSSKTHYNWRVRAGNATSSSPWTQDVDGFTTIETSSNL
ncbi:fibronectin type III domain-containing protein, partial [Candidatus Berkelbacteria bacterium]|nr:fibronectin type III domain-containing protein [Candidatus Berkelbacteria bacterium]